MMTNHCAQGVSGPNRPVCTYSIVSHDPVTGELGVAVQSHWFSVGGCVPWAEAGVGAVATQSFIEPSYGPLGLSFMRAGKSARQALKALLAIDADRDFRQVAMVDSKGRVAVHTGKRCIAAAGHVTGKGFSVQANMMAKETVWPAMKVAFEKSTADLAERLLSVLEAAEAQGGDIRGRQSAAILVVKGNSGGRPWAERRFDLRVEDHPKPLFELRRLLNLARAYEHMNRGDELATQGAHKAAGNAYEKAAQLIPQEMECPFWHGIMLAAAEKLEEARPLFARVFATEPHWRELVRRLPAAGLLPDESSLVERIIGIGM